MVINIGWAKAGLYDLIRDEIGEIKKACNGKLLKVIIETCLLSEEEKTALCKVVSQTGAEYIKTSTGFSACGATFEDAERFLELGADRLGTSKLVKIIKQQGGTGMVSPGNEGY